MSGLGEEETLPQASQGRREEEEPLSDVPIVAAAMAGDYAEIERILSKKPGAVNESDEDDSTALICCTVGGYLNIVKLLLDRAADPDKQDQIGGYTALILAAKYNYIDICKTLVQRGADTQKKDFEGKIASAYARNEEIKKILGRVSDMNDSIVMGYYCYLCYGIFQFIGPSY
jgi:ankyrin repeat protein